MAGVKYYVWASGAWREVQASGRVAGWQRRARFLFVRRGRLQLAPRGVLRALAAHAAGEPSAVRDGPRLSQRSYAHSYKANKTPGTGDKAHWTKSTVIPRSTPAPRPAPAATATTTTTTTTTTNISTQCATQADASPTRARAPATTHDIKLNIFARKKNSSGEDFQRKPTLKPGPRSQRDRRALTNSGFQKQTPTKRSRISSSSESLTGFVTKKTVADIEPVPIKLGGKSPKKYKSGECGTSGESEVMVKMKISANNKHGPRTPSKTKPGNKIRVAVVAQPISSKQGEPDTSNDGIKVIYDRSKLRNHRAGKTKREETENEPRVKKPRIDEDKAVHRNKLESKPIPTIRKQQTLTDTSESESSDIIPANVTAKKQDFSSSASEEHPPLKVLQKSQLGRKGPTTSSKDVICKDFSTNRNILLRRARRGPQLELVVPEEDVDVLRAFIERTASPDLEKFDADVEFKTALFYSINPLVYIERCAGLERALKERKLKQFTEGLGLRSVSEVSTQASTCKIRLRSANTSLKMSSSASDAEENDRLRSYKNNSKGSRNISKSKTNKLNVQKCVRTDDSSRDISVDLSRVKRDRTKLLSNKTSVQKSEFTRDRSKETTREPNRERTTKSVNKHNVYKAQNARISSQDIMKLVNKTMNNKHTSEYNSDSSEDISKELSKHRNSTSQTKTSKKKPSGLTSESTGDTSEDSTQEPINERTSRSQTMKVKYKPSAHTSESTGDTSEDSTQEQINDRTSRSETKKSLNKHSANKSEATGDTSGHSATEPIKYRTRRSQSKQAKNKTKAHKSESTEDISEASAEELSVDRTSRSQTKKPKSKPTANNFDSTRDTSEASANEPIKDKTSKSKTKKLTNKPSAHRSEFTRDSSEDNTKENSNNIIIEKGKMRSGKGTKVVESRAEYKENVAQRANRLREADARRDEAARASEDELATSKEALLQSSRTSHTISNRPSALAKEYSNLEDHAIVAWVSGGARARRVNGNALWRDLQDQYPALAGRTRSWHSLRNRYLRYILPSLAALRLPPAHAARLRAAAATGPLKSKRMPPRRNSIFDKEPLVRGASSRRPARSDSSSRRPAQSESSSRRPAQSESSSRRPARSDSSSRRPAQSESSSRRPAQSESSSRRPARSDSSSRRPARSDSSSRRPAQSESSSRRPAQSESSSRRPARSDSSSRRPARSESASRRPARSKSSSRRPTQPDSSPTRAHESTGPTTPERAPSRRSLRSAAAPAAAAAPAPAAASPRYSDVTRRFAARRLRSTPRGSAGEPDPPPPPPPPPPPAPPAPAPAARTRRLFNPKAPM